MAAPLKVITVALCGALAALGLGLGSESQHEVFLEPDLAARDAANASGAAGNLVVLTAVLVALAAALAVGLLSERRFLARLAGSAVVFAGTYLTVLVAQSSWPNYNAQLEARYADLANSLLAANVPAVPSILVPVLALALAAILTTGVAARRLLRRGPTSPTPETLLVRQVAAILLATPFLVVAAWGCLWLLVNLPENQPGLGPYFVLLPLAAAASLALLAVALAKAWRLGSFVRNGHLAASVQESWQTLGRAEAALAAVLAALALLSSLFPAAPAPGLDLGRVFGVTLRGHLQALLLLVIPLAPLWPAHRATATYLAAAPLHRGTLETATHPLARAALAAVLAAFVLAGVATLFAADALWAWAVALVPVAALAQARCDAVRAAPVTLLLAYVLWGIGNTVVAHYDGNHEALLELRDAPGVLALWRTLGALAGGWALARLALSAAPDQPKAAAVPMALGTGACLAAVALLEMPLSAWLLNRGGGEAIAVGSVMASLDLPVRVLLHVLSGALAVAAAVLLARLHRPDWFRPPPPPRLPAKVRSKTTGRAAARPTA